MCCSTTGAVSRIQMILCSIRLAVMCTLTTSLFYLLVYDLSLDITYVVIPHSIAASVQPYKANFLKITTIEKIWRQRRNCDRKFTKYHHSFVDNYDRIKVTFTVQTHRIVNQLLHEILNLHINKSLF